MQNIDMKLEGDTLVLRINLSQNYGPSKSGKTLTVGNTGGFAEIPGKQGYRVNVNVIRNPQLG